MCIAFASSKGHPIPFHDLQEGCKSNPHGFGFAYADNGEVFIVKGFFSFKEAWEAFKPINGNYNSIFHARWANCGSHNAQNCHPWRVNATHAMMHNGTLKPYAKVHNSLSDTGNFNEQILKPLIKANPEIIKTPYFNSIMGQAIGDGNKVVILNGQGDIIIFNEHLGNWKNGVWASNFDYIPLKKKKKKVKNKLAV